MSFVNQPPIIRKDPTDTEITSKKITLIVFMCVMNVIMLFGNSLSIATICYTKSLRKQVSYWFVLNLAIIDLIASVTVVPLNIVWEYHGIWPLDHATCDFFTFADIAFSTISAYSIVLVSIDKYMYISYSIHYYQRMTKRNAGILISIVWIIVFTFAAIPVFTNVAINEEQKDQYIELSNGTRTCIFVMTDSFVVISAIFRFFIPFAILCLTSLKTVCIARKHIRKIQGVTKSTTSDKKKSFKNQILSSQSEPKLIYMTCQSNQNKSLTYTSSPNVPQENPTSNNRDQARIGFDITNKVSQIPDCGANCTTKCNTAEPENAKNKKQSKNLQEDSGSIKSNEVGVKSELSNQAPTLDCTTAIHEQIENNNQSTTDNNLTIVPSKLPEQENNESECNKNCDLSTQSKHVKTRTSHLRHSDSMKSIARKRSPYCKLFGTVSIVIVFFVVMFAPYYFATITDIWCRCLKAWIYEDILAVLYYMHSFVNPYIYMATDRKFKAALKILWGKICLIFYV